MSKIEDNIDLVNDKIEGEVSRFIKGVDKSQKGIFNRLLAIVKGVETDDQGNIKQTVKNLKLLAKVRKTIENEIITDAYINRVDILTNQFPAIAELNNGYFETLSASFNPNRELFKEVIKNSINVTRTSLLDSGIAENVINPIVNIVDNSVTNGAAFGDMVDELRLIIKGDKERLGQLLRYSKQITSDALNQFNASYNETIANDLDLEWYFYSGGKRRTSRPFCKKYAGRYFHKKEVEDFGRRKDLDGSNLCGGSTKTNLCTGRIPGTNASSIFRLRGGYQCKHIYKPTLIDSVPKSVVNRNVKKGYFIPEDEEITQVQETKQFIPAKTIKEAETFAIENKLAKKVNYKKLKLDGANSANKQLLNLKQKTGKSFDEIETIRRKSVNDAGVLMSDLTSYKSNGVYDKNTLIINGGTFDYLKKNSALINFQYKININENDNFLTTMNLWTKTINKQGWWVQKKWDDAINHEFGHMLTSVKTNFKDAKQRSNVFRFKGDSSISKYAGTNGDETLAEIFSKYRIQGKTELTKDQIKFFNENSSWQIP